LKISKLGLDKPKQPDIIEDSNAVGCQVCEDPTVFLCAWHLAKEQKNEKAFMTLSILLKRYGCGLHIED